MCSEISLHVHSTISKFESLAEEKKYKGSLQKLFKDAELLGGFPRKEALIHKTTELLGGTANVALLESIAQTLLVMLANPDCEALFLAQPHSLATLIDLLPRYAANPSLYGGLTLSILRIFERTSANPVNHGVLLEAESLSHLHALISTAAGGIALPDIELALAPADPARLQSVRYPSSH